MKTKRHFLPYIPPYFCAYLEDLSRGPPRHARHEDAICCQLRAVQVSLGDEE